MPFKKIYINNLYSKYIYIYIERERERERESQVKRKGNTLAPKKKKKKSNFTISNNNLTKLVYFNQIILYRRKVPIQRYILDNNYSNFLKKKKKLKPISLIPYNFLQILYQFFRFVYFQIYTQKNFHKNSRNYRNPSQKHVLTAQCLTLKQSNFSQATLIQLNLSKRSATQPNHRLNPSKLKLSPLVA